MAGFTVDTKLFRELGEFLVGRDSTALVELIKNSYDADATLVEIVGQGLGSPQTGSILVKDNGIGMTAAEFSRGFLRIAGRTKTEAERRSPWFGRRYTGEKGVGRLAAHKLAHRLQILSRRWNGSNRRRLTGFPADEEISASIDWDAIERLETLDQVEASDAVTLRPRRREQSSAGTRLTMAPLRRAWGTRDLTRFFDEVATLTPPPALIAPLTERVVPRPVLLEQLRQRDDLRRGNFEIVFGGELRLSDSDLPADPESASWIMEIECDADSHHLRIGVAPTRQTQQEYTNAESFVLERELPLDQPIVSFQARILQREYQSWPRRYRGVRVYHEGFRVLPYGDVRDDWLDLDRDYRSRGKGELGRLRAHSNWELPPGLADEALSIQGNGNFFGAVLLTRNGANALEMLVNREGFLPSEHFDFIADTVRLAIDLQVRLRYAATSVVKQARRISQTRQVRAARRAASGQSPSAFLVGSPGTELEFAL